MKALIILLVLCVLGAEAKPKGKRMALKDDLEAYYNMEQNPILFPVHDQSGNGHHLTGFGALSQVAGKFGKAIQFAADDQFLDLLTTVHVPLDLNGTDFTVATWFKVTEMGSNMGILGSHFTKWYARVLLSGGSYYVNVKINGGSMTVTEVPLETGRWYFLAFGWHDSPSDEFGQYSWATVNLAVRERESRTPFANDNPAFAIGAAGTGSAFRGAVGATAIWSRRVAAEELYALYNKTNGLPFEEWGDPETCRSIECCD